MTLATLHGRLQTKLVNFILLGALTTPFALIWGYQIWQIFAVAIVVGLTLEAIWGVVIEHQPGWLTIILAILEFLLITAVAIALQVSVTLVQAAIYYFVSWTLIQLFFIYILPVFRIDWTDNGSELW